MVIYLYELYKYYENILFVFYKDILTKTSNFVYAFIALQRAIYVLTYYTIYSTRIM